MEYFAKCRECSFLIENKTMVIFDNGQLVHIHCWARIKMQERKHESRIMIRESHGLLSSSEARLAGVTSSLRCDVCGKRISDRFDLSIHGSRVRHRACGVEDEGGRDLPSK